MRLGVLCVWQVDPLRHRACQDPMRVIADIDDPPAVEEVPGHLGAWPAAFAGLSARYERVNNQFSPYRWSLKKQIPERQGEVLLLRG